MTGRLDVSIDSPPILRKVTVRKPTNVHYALKDYNFVDFASGMTVLDVGCGEGKELEQADRKGCLAIGLDVDDAALADCRRRGLKVIHAVAEHMPIESASIDGVICRFVVPLTDEAMVLREIGRVLKTGGRGHLSYHGIGYYVRFILVFSILRRFIYALRTLINTWFYAVTGRRLPGFIGDTLYQSRRRLAKYYRNNGLKLIHETPTQKFLGLSVVIHHEIQKTAQEDTGTFDKLEKTGKIS